MTCFICNAIGFRRCLAAALLVVAALQMPLLAAQPDLGAIRPGDAVTISVASEDPFGGKYVVEADGAIALPLLGRVPASSLTPGELEAALRRRLLEFYVNPEVRVAVTRTGRVFVLGDVETAGPLELTAHLTLLEALARAGYTGNSEIILVRPRSAEGPASPQDPGTEVKRINLRNLEKAVEDGRLSDNVLLADGDTIYVPPDDPNQVYISGEVRKPGAYSIADGTTVLQAVTLAGGVTEDGVLARLRVVRLVGDEQRSQSAKLSDRLEPGDTVVVPERFAFPTLQAGSGSAQRPAREYHLGRAFSFAPIAVLRRIGFDTNVLSESDETVTDFTVVGGPQLNVLLDLRRVRATATGVADFVYYRRYASERSVDRMGVGAIELLPWRPITLRVGGSQVRTSDRLSAEVDARVRRFERALDAALQITPGSRLYVELGGRTFERIYDSGAMYLGVDLGDTLTEEVRSATATVRLGMTRMTSLVLSGAASTHRFPRYSAKDADSAEAFVGAIFKAGALISGEGRVGYLRYLGLNPIAPDLRSPVGRVELSYQPLDRTRLGVRAGRETGDSFRPQFAYALVDRIGGSIEQGIFDRFDLRAETYREKYSYRVFGFENVPAPPGGPSEDTLRYASELGVRFGPTRLGFNVTYIQRLSEIHRGRQYDAMYATANFSFGALDVRGR